MKARQLEKLGLPPGRALKLAKWLAVEARRQGMDHVQIKMRLAAIAADPEAHRDDPVFGDLARQLAQLKQQAANAAGAAAPRSEPAPWKQWGRDLDPASVQQMENACRLPVSVRGALMPDAHVGYGLPIGGVLATDHAVIPYAVGVDIACRMKLTVLDLPPDLLTRQPDRLIRALEEETRFGMGAQFDPHHRRQHPVMDEDWSVTSLTQHLKDKAWAQLGTSGSGNHFVEYGLLTPAPGKGEGTPLLPLENRPYLALLSHSGSRGAGAQVAGHYSRLASALHPELPRELQHLAWLDLATPEGQEYWQAMQLMGRYAAANHACIHRALARRLGAQVLLDLENHHNFAWEEEHDGRRVIVHRKGATPAGVGVLGIIPGSMASPGYIVRGRGNAAALNSAAHGAGRVMSRTQARNTYRWATVRPVLEERGVKLLSAGIDEAPMVYKNIDEVMAAQQDLVEPLARFDPRIVKMAPEGEKAED